MYVFVYTFRYFCPTLSKLEHVSKCVDSPIINLVKMHYTRSDRRTERQASRHGEANWRIFANYSHKRSKKVSLKWVIYRQFWVNCHVISILICFPVCILYYIQLFCNLHMRVFRASLNRRPQKWDKIMSVWMSHFRTCPIFCLWYYETNFELYFEPFRISIWFRHSTCTISLTTPMKMQRLRESACIT
jgi:hypothetical protein